jgi:hypothetical protein
MFLKKLMFSSILLCASLCCPEEDIEDCSLVNCVAVDNSIYITFVDNTSGENLITDGTYDATQIEIVDLDSNPVNFELQKDLENEDALVVDLQNTTIGNQDYRILLGDTVSFNFTLTTFSGAGSICCGPYTGIDNASLTGIEGEFVNQGTLPIAITVFIP